MAEAKKKPVKKQIKEAELVVEAAPEKTEEVEVKETKPVASTKAGKHSAKAIRETEAKVEKEERKAAAKTDEPKKEVSVKKPARSRTERAGKKYREVAKLVEKGKIYDLAEALELATKTSTTKFDATVEMHINLGVDPKQADQNVRDIVVLPAGTGKTVRVAALVEADDVAKAKTAGADIAGSDDLLAELDKENIEFDVLVATPSMMPKLGKYARLLGPRGLMPNPKSGTVTADVAGAIKGAKAGRVEYRVDQAGIVHLGIGKVSFGKDKLLQNAQAVADSIRAAKPASLKNVYVKSAYVTTSMGPGISVQI